MRKATAVLVVFVVSLFAFQESNVVPSKPSVPVSSVSDNRIVLQEEAVVTITAWLGSTSCRSGNILLESPSELRIISKNFDFPKTGKKDPNEKLLIPNYGEGKKTITIGPYTQGTKVVLALSPGSFCRGTFLSIDPTRNKIIGYHANVYNYAWEDYTDGDFNDVNTEIAIRPVPSLLSDSVTAVQAFSDNPTYRLPWPEGEKHKLTSFPGYGDEHKTIDAYDFDMKDGDVIVASEQGMVLWVEDSFGSGACSASLANRANVVVIQTEAVVNQTYVHLKKGSVKEFGIAPGQIVKQGQSIGRAGNSGYSCSSNGGPSTHLHIEWQHHCYNFEDLRTLRPKQGTPTFKWSCPNFPPDAPYRFEYRGKEEILRNINFAYVSDNYFGP